MFKLVLRFLKDEFHAILTKTAAKNHRSLNSEINRAIEYYIQNAPEAQLETSDENENPTNKRP